MPTVEVVNLSNQRSGELELDPRFFEAPVRSSLLHEAVVMQRANERQGTACTKTRGEVSGSGKKPWRQKGTGRARIGSLRSPLWRTGGVVFGPRPRRYTQSLPKKKVRAALFGALTVKLREGAFKVIEGFSLAEPKTREIEKIRHQLGLEGKVLFLMEQPSESVQRAARNLPSVTLKPLGQVNVYDVLEHDYLLIPKQDLQALEERFRRRVGRPGKSRGTHEA